MLSVTLSSSLSGNPSWFKCHDDGLILYRQNPSYRIWSSGVSLQAEQLLINNRKQQDAITNTQRHMTKEDHRGAQSTSSLSDDSGESLEDLASLNSPHLSPALGPLPNTGSSTDDWAQNGHNSKGPALSICLAHCAKSGRAFIDKKDVFFAFFLGILWGGRCKPKHGHLLGIWSSTWGNIHSARLSLLLCAHTQAYVHDSSSWAKPLMLHCERVLFVDLGAITNTSFGIETCHMECQYRG